MGGGKSILEGVYSGNMLGYDLPFGCGKRGDGWFVHKAIGFRGSFNFNCRFVDPSLELDNVTPVIATLLLVSFSFESGFGFLLSAFVDFSLSTFALL